MYIQIVSKFAIAEEYTLLTSVFFKYFKSYFSFISSPNGAIDTISENKLEIGR